MDGTKEGFTPLYIRPKWDMDGVSHGSGEYEVLKVTREE
jgi:hypothetical protein